MIKTTVFNYGNKPRITIYHINTVKNQLDSTNLQLTSNHHKTDYYLLLQTWKNLAARKGSRGGKTHRKTTLRRTRATVRTRAGAAESADWLRSFRQKFPSVEKFLLLFLFSLYSLCIRALMWLM